VPWAGDWQGGGWEGVGGGREGSGSLAATVPSRPAAQAQPWSERGGIRGKEAGRREVEGIGNRETGEVAAATNIFHGASAVLAINSLDSHQYAPLPSSPVCQNIIDYQSIATSRGTGTHTY
jgi:hypothetical protein